MFRKEHRFLFAVCGVVCNNFPWSSPAEEQKQKIEAAQGIPDARALYPDCSIADLCDPLTMPSGCGTGTAGG